MNKEALLIQLKNNLSEKLNHLDQLIEDMRASNNETKSSMGDKYETSREMLQQEINNLTVQKIEINKQKDDLAKITANTSNAVSVGSLIKTSNAWFYISISAGTITLQDTKIMTISPSAPLAIALLNKKVGDTVVFNNNQHTILELH